ncbi:Uncharacterised protein family UPF0272 [Plasmopara halstedii]|uniref:Uncharacterized protein family UPF0272 n=1 Tax=Plasmopara halstedii TaxID=4781 RepID=A0A0P1B6X4_PLAHL|nr:Uncharacterised protein family UPF0272 [Plasmopara halstedii]CEG50181.1 Uncharacterised protein family UPF0272 [Plasmopara halstedii]|eukprot:XP_024586550.1 Uncharacterised protein family UPF0272 [Plasmopara halstedii]
MKKNRPGVCLSILCYPEHEQEILETLFRETSTLGVRRNTMDRVSLSRKFVQVSAFGSSVDVKVAFLGNEAVNVHPEFEHYGITVKNIKGSVNNEVSRFLKA